MAIVNQVTPETIEKLRGNIDFYMLRGILPVARKWPKKPTPPYTALQAEGMEAFKIACANMKRLTPNILQVWQAGTEGKREQWTDVFKGLIMKYWKTKRVIAPIAIDYEIIETATTFRIKWYILEVFLDPSIPEVLSDESTLDIDKVDMALVKQPIYFSLYDEEDNRLVAPMIKLGFVT